MKPEYSRFNQNLESLIIHFRKIKEISEDALDIGAYLNLYMIKKAFDENLIPERDLKMLVCGEIPFFSFRNFLGGREYSFTPEGDFLVKKLLFRKPKPYLDVTQLNF